LPYQIENNENQPVMKTFCTITLLVFSLPFLFSQSERIQNLEKLLPSVNGEEYLKNVLTLADWYYQEGLFEKSAEKAEDAFKAAKKLKLNSYMAVALNQGGKALMKMPSKRDAPRKKAFSNFKQSNELTSDPQLRMDNLLQMRELATILGKKDDLVDINKDIELLNAEGIKKQNQELAAKVETLGATTSELSQEKEQLSQQKEQLSNQRKLLQTVVKQKEAAIQSMSAAQIKQQLLLMEQERVLDSMTFSSIIDSFELSQKEMTVKQQEAELREKEAEIQLRNSQRNLLLAIAGIVLIVAAGLFHRYHVIRSHNAVLGEKNRIIEAERKRSEELLLNILPVAVASELKEKGFANAKKFQHVTVLFTDFQGFSAISKKMPPEQLVNDLDYAFKNFDRIIGKFGLEKIKTIGDAYMCAGGIPAEDASHPVNVVHAALEIQDFLDGWNRGKRDKGHPPFEARIGIHTGPIVAGVVGSKKFAYDIWGDTVNVASRMESSSEAGRVNISSATYSFVKNVFECEYRGKVPAKNVGEVEMYFVKKRAA
jgi:class 3 adenylate cyclase